MAATGKRMGESDGSDPVPERQEVRRRDGSASERVVSRSLPEPIMCPVCGKPQWCDLNAFLCRRADCPGARRG